MTIILFTVFLLADKIFMQLSVSYVSVDRNKDRNKIIVWEY